MSICKCRMCNTCLKGPKSGFGLKGVTFEETLNENIGLKHEHANTYRILRSRQVWCKLLVWI